MTCAQGGPPDAREGLALGVHHEQRLVRSPHHRRQVRHVVLHQRVAPLRIRVLNAQAGMEGQ